MKIEEIETRLKNGEQLGFDKESNDPNFVGWVLLTKEQPNTQYLRQFPPSTDADFVKEVLIPFTDEQELVRRKPYRLLITEWKRDAYYNAGYGTPEDIRFADNFRFVDLSEVSQFLNGFGLFLEDIKRRGEDFEPP